jgi:hypothetical protein
VANPLDAMLNGHYLRLPMRQRSDGYEIVGGLCCGLASQNELWMVCVTLPSVDRLDRLPITQAHVSA